MFDVDDDDACVPLVSAVCVPGASDTDRDGISDADETVLRSKTNDPDSDHDGLWDTWEIRDAQGPRIDEVDTDGNGDVNWLDPDADCDGIPDGLEGRLNVQGLDAPPRQYLTGTPAQVFAPNALCAIVGPEI